MHPNFLYGKTLPDGRPNFLTDYGFNFQNYGALGTNHSKCCVTSPFGNELNFGHLYTISKAEKVLYTFIFLRTTNLEMLLQEERTYDEPYTGDLTRRSWLCCPGSQAKTESDQPPLLEEAKSPTTPSETITQPPGFVSVACSGTCVCIYVSQRQKLFNVIQKLFTLTLVFVL